MVNLAVYSDDYGYVINFTVLNVSGAPVNLAEYTPYFKAWHNLGGGLAINTVCTVVNADLGTCNYQVEAADFQTAGKMMGKIEIRKSGVRESINPFTITVVEAR